MLSAVNSKQPSASSCCLLSTVYCLLSTDLGFAGARIFRQHQFEGVRGFDSPFLLQFINPIGYSLNHFARGLRGRVPLRRGLLLAHSLVLLDDFDRFLF